VRYLRLLSKVNIAFETEKIISPIVSVAGSYKTLNNICNNHIAIVVNAKKTITISLWAHIAISNKNKRY
jgi:hypothetical protein